MMPIHLNMEQEKLVKARIKLAKEHQAEAWRCDGESDSRFEDKPEFWIALLRGRYWLNVPSDTPAPRRMNNQILPKLTVKHDILCAGETEFFVEAREERFKDTIEASEGAVNTTWSIEDYDSVVKRMRWDSDPYTFGVVEQGWRFRRKGEQAQTGERGEALGVAEDAEPIIVLEGGLAMDQGSVEYETEAQAEAAARHSKLEDDAVVWGNPVEDGPYIERFCPRDLLVDPNCTRPDLADARYAFRRRYVQPNKLKANRKLTLPKDGLKGTVYSVRKPVPERTNATLDAGPSQDALVEIYDGYMWIDLKDNGEERFVHVIVADSVDTPLLVDENPYSDEDGEPAFGDSPYPWVVHPGPVADNDRFYPESGIEQVADLQLAYDESFHAFNEIRRKSPRMTMGPKGAMDDDVREKVEAGVDMAHIEVDAALLDSIKPWPVSNAPIEVFQSLEMLPIEVGRQLGITPYEEAIAPAKEMRVKEVEAVQQVGSTRTSGEAQRFRQTKERIATRLLILYQIFGDRSRSYRYKDAESNTKWGVFRNTDLRGTETDGVTPLPVGIQHMVKVNADSVNPKNAQADQREKMALVQALSGFAQIPGPDGSPMVNMRAALKMLLTSFGIHDTSALLPEPGPALPPAVPGPGGTGSPAVAPPATQGGIQ